MTAQRESSNNGTAHSRESPALAFHSPFSEYKKLLFSENAAAGKIIIKIKRASFFKKVTPFDLL